MRFQRLDLTRFGKFTDRQIVFGEKQTGMPDLHVVYGPNEAGKSTTMSAMMDLLFGIPTQSPYSFLHDYKSMRVGALLEMPDGLRDIFRLKKNSPSLFDGNSEPFAEGLLATALGGISREAYMAMFSLDDETLEEGGESILASQGDLGQLLFSASAGLAGFSKALSGLRQMTDSFTRPSGRGTELAALKDELVQLGKARDEIDIRANEYARLVEQRDSATAAYQAMLGDRARLDVSIEKLERQLSAQPLWRELLEIRKEIAQTSAIPDAPQSWLAEIRDLERRMTVLATEMSLGAKRVSGLQQDFGAITIDSAALNIEPQVEALEPLHARYSTAQIDIPKLELQLRETDRDVESIVHLLGQKGHSSPKDLILDAATVSSLRHLIETRSGLDAALETSKKELAYANEQIEALQKKEGNGTKQEGLDISYLTSQLAAARSQDYDQRIRSMESSLQKQDFELQMALKTVLPWTGTVADLDAISVPTPDELSHWKNELKVLEARVQLATSEREKAERELARLEAEYVVLKQSLGAVSDVSAEQTRQERETIWAEHRGLLSSESAALFESAMRKDDHAWAARLIRSTDIARMTEIETSRAVLSVDLQKTDLMLEQTKGKMAVIHRALRAFWQTVSPDSEGILTPDAIEQWIAKRETVLKSSYVLELLRLELDTARNHRDTAKSQLAKALAEHGIEADDKDFSVLIHEAQTVVDGFAFRKAELEKRADAERNLACRRKLLEQAKADLVQWQITWDEIGNRCWFGAGHAIAVVREWLLQLARLSPALDVKSNLTDRIEKMRADQATFLEKTKSLAQQLDLPVSDQDPISLWHALQSRVRHAKKNADLKDTTQKDIDFEKRAMEDLNGQHAVLDIEKQRFCDHFFVESLEQALLKLDEVNQRNALLIQARRLEPQLSNLLDVDTINAVEHMIVELDFPAIAEEISRQKSEKADYDQRIPELYAVKSKAEDRVDAVGGDDQVARIEEKRRTVLLEIEDRAVNYVKLRGGILAAEQALRIYREEHRSVMMKRASDAFTMISRGAYTGLAAQPEKDTEILIAIASDGSSKIAKDMSKGTRFQLYLALRMAGYHEFAATRGSVPFLADDIMETFDDFRAEETFRLFAHMASVGQVIYFTHHRHLCDIAKSVAPNVKIHNL